MGPASKIRDIRLVAALTLTLFGAVGTAAIVRAQPEPSFRSTCRDLRENVQSSNIEKAEIAVIEVVGPLRDVQFDGTLTYMLMCSQPDPEVLCVTYSPDGRKAGDVVALSGTFSQQGPDHILLDPCLHSPPD